MSTDFDTEIDVRIAEDLTHSDVAPLSDALAPAAFRIRVTRHAWSGPAAGGPDIGLWITVSGAIAGGWFAKVFVEELAKDVYRSARAAVCSIARGLRARSPESVRADIPLTIEAGALRFYFGSSLHDDPEAGEWTDEWFVLRLRRANAAIEAVPSLLLELRVHDLVAHEDIDGGDRLAFNFAGFWWDDKHGIWVADDGMVRMIQWARKHSES